ncbi:MAG: IS1 family transposase [Syntrophobacteraceae bacterium]|nr:IS1 family transposase [Syntrophobacteraceae bacterium]
MPAADIPKRGEAKCPQCQSEAVYRYGKTKNGKQRFICIVCRRQFSLDSPRSQIIAKPVCPECGNPMHVYMRDLGVTRFRCSQYPACRTYLKMKNEPEEIGR